LILAKLVAEIAKDHSWCQQLQMWRDLTRFVYTAYISAPIKVLAYTVCASLPWPPFCSTKRLYSRRPGRRQIELFEIKVDVHPSKRDFEEDDHVQQHERYREEHTQQATDRRRHPVSHAGVHFSVTVGLAIFKDQSAASTHQRRDGILALSPVFTGPHIVVFAAVLIRQFNHCNSSCCSISNEFPSFQPIHIMPLKHRLRRGFHDNDVTDWSLLQTWNYM